MRPQHEERRARLLGDALAQTGLDRVHVLGHLAELHDVPSIRLEPLGHVVAVRELGRTVDRDVVVVVHEDESSEPQVTGERRRLVTDALHQVAVAANPEHVVVAHRRAEALAQVLLLDRHADRVAKALPERTGRDLHAGRVAVLGVAGGA